MIQSVTLLSENIKITVDSAIKYNKFIIDCQSVINKSSFFTIQIDFTDPVKLIRNHNYTWTDANCDFIANEFSPKIIKLSNGFFVQPNLQIGVWEFEKKNPSRLLWKFNPLNSKPLTFYTGNSNEKIIAQANSQINFIETPALLFSNKKPIEFSRSKIPFSAIACFTDHCDFDTLENLQLQRVFFKEKAIKVTKGFFLNHFSKREDNASYENQKNEIDLWKNDLHELCYHSLSQSIKSDDDSFSDFENFEPPYLDIPTWIDHGYQPYNFSLYKNFNKEDAYFESVLIKKNITILWNYIDCGTATRGVINQLNGSHFTLSSFLKGNKNLSFIKRMQLMIKNIIFHYYATQDIILKYKSLAQNFKNIIYKKQIMLVFKLVSNFISISKPILAVFLGWNKHKNTPFKYAKYSPIFFKHRIAEKEFYIFQTLEMVDFKKSLSKENIDLLLQEKGLFIAHTYFSVPMNYHQGKMFATTSKIDQEVAANFNYLSENIKNNNIWNPTISELIGYMKNFENSILDINPEGTILVKSSANLLFRTVD